MNTGAPQPGDTLSLPAGSGEAVLRRALSRGGDLAEVFAEKRSSLSMRLEDGKIENVVSGFDRGASVRLLSGLSTAFGYVDSLEEEALLALADEVSHSREGAPVTVVTPGEPEVGPRGWVVRDPAEVE